MSRVYVNMVFWVWIFGKLLGNFEGTFGAREDVKYPVY